MSWQLSLCVRLALYLSLAIGSIFPLTAGAQDASSAFDQANKLYEEGKFYEAAAAYGKLADAGYASPSLYFNLGNAWFKAGQNGRAIAAYRRALRLEPRDPDIRFNLRFVRKQVTGSTAVSPWWERWLTTLTLNEWTLLAACVYWIWGLLLVLREARPGLKAALRGYTSTAGAATLLLVACLAAAAYQRWAATPGVVIVPQAVVRYGPLDESQVNFQLRDGQEVQVIGRKQVNAGERPQLWLQVEDAEGRVGWIKNEEVMILWPAASKANEL